MKIFVTSQLKQNVSVELFLQIKAQATIHSAVITDENVRPLCLVFSVGHDITKKSFICQSFQKFYQNEFFQRNSTF